MLTMMLGGLWHGADWIFIIWGTYQGFMLVTHRFISRKINLQRFDNFLIIRILKIVFMFQITCLGWLIFRSGSVEQLVNFAKKLIIHVDYQITSEAVYYMKLLLFYSSLVILVQYIQKKTDNAFFIYRFPKLVQVSVYVLLLLIILIWGSFGSREFIYFQF